MRLKHKQVLILNVRHPCVCQFYTELATLSVKIKECCFCIFNMAGMHLLSDQGLRLDGRRANELRQIRCKLGVFSQPDGSAYLEQGNTKVLAAVYGPHEVGNAYQFNT
jgi:polyribonucleotide nucleotidyltransferase